MPRRELHLVIGLFIAILFSYLFSLFYGGEMNVGILSVWIIASIIGSVLPDIIEPGGRGKWNHRKFFHSKKLLKIIGILLILTFSLIILQWYPANSLFFFFLGYASHLLADSTSKMDLSR